MFSPRIEAHMSKKEFVFSQKMLQLTLPQDPKCGGNISRSSATTIGLILEAKSCQDLMQLNPKTIELQCYMSKTAVQMTCKVAFGP